eukprot:TRINITY_DN46396_c0_g1_i1.p1 TRINITY_DN46396_c0_g1~~TRINITY_DN46396_c0_g1_i1.p1  ORF type:complete len:338 (+),score=22.16 TRINITY_DN46396_c0_g1_i1:18-1031(+)
MARRRSTVDALRPASAPAAAVSGAQHSRTTATARQGRQTATSRDVSPAYLGVSDFPRPRQRGGTAQQGRRTAKSRDVSPADILRVRVSAPDLTRGPHAERRSKIAPLSPFVSRQEVPQSARRSDQMVVVQAHNDWRDLRPMVEVRSKYVPLVSTPRTHVSSEQTRDSMQQATSSGPSKSTAAAPAAEAYRPETVRSAHAEARCKYSGLHTKASIEGKTVDEKQPPEKNRVERISFWGSSAPHPAIPVALPEGACRSPLSSIKGGGWDIFLSKRTIAKVTSAPELQDSSCPSLSTTLCDKSRRLVRGTPTMDKRCSKRSCCALSDSVTSGNGTVVPWR